MTGTPGHDHDEHPMPYVRNLAVLAFEDGTEITIDHVFAPGAEPCPDCGSPSIAPGLVGMTVDDPRVLMSVEEALVLINRLTRAVNLVLEAQEDPPDPVREAARFGAVPDSPEGLS